uniref:Uncharacterized protein n=1 Tax=Glossina pallidipes TaxID=7398 RepID=A0A1B0ACF6_GLOPL
MVEDHLRRGSWQNENTDQQSHIFEKSSLTSELISTFPPENFYYTNNHNNHNNNDDYKFHIKRDESTTATITVLRAIYDLSFKDYSQQFRILSLLHIEVAGRLIHHLMLFMGLERGIVVRCLSFPSYNTAYN